MGGQLSYASCCLGKFAEQDACFFKLGGWFSFDFCCYPVVPEDRHCDWEAIAQAWPAEYRGYPMTIRELSCQIPDGLSSSDPKVAQNALSWQTVQCCFPMLRRKLWSSTEKDPSWLHKALDREFAALVGQQWSSADLDAFNATREWPDAPLVRPCRLSMHGREVFHEDLKHCCLLFDNNGNPDPNNDCSYIRSVRAALLIIGSIRPLPAIDILVSPGGQDRWNTTVPVFTRNQAREPRGRLLLLPKEWQLNPGQVRDAGVAERFAVRIPWEKRRPILFWRGSNSNCMLSCSITEAARGTYPLHACLDGYNCDAAWNISNWQNTPSGRLVLASQVLPGVDARFASTSERMDPELWRFLSTNNFTASFMNAEQQCFGRYAINVNGEGSADRIYFQMQMGHAVLLQESPWRSWLISNDIQDASGLIPFQHFLPARYDLSDLGDKLAWLRTNDAQAKWMAEQAYKFVKLNLDYSGILLYVDRAIRRFAKDHFLSKE